MNGKKLNAQRRLMPVFWVFQLNPGGLTLYRAFGVYKLIKRQLKSKEKGADGLPTFATLEAGDKRDQIFEGRSSIVRPTLIGQPSSCVVNPEGGRRIRPMSAVTWLKAPVLNRCTPTKRRKSGKQNRTANLRRGTRRLEWTA